MSEAPDRGEAIRLAGVIREIAVAPRRWRARVAGTTGNATDDGTIVVEVDGAPVEVEVAGQALIDDGGVTSGAWGELATQAGGRFRADTAPAFAAATLAVTAVEVGQPVAIYGEVAARGFAEDGGPREAPTSRVTRVRALLLSAGAGADARLTREIERRHPPASRPVRPSWFKRWLDAHQAKRAARIADPRSRDPGHRLYLHDPVARAVTAVLAVTTAGLGVWSLSSSSVHAYTIAAAVALVLWCPTAPMRGFHAREARHGLAWHPSEGWWVAGFLAYVGFVSSTAFVDVRGVSVVSLAMVVVAVGIGIIGEPTYSRQRRMLRATPWRGEVGVDASIEGVVRDPSPVTVGTRAVAIGRGTGYDAVPGSNPDQLLWHRFHGDGTFLVETAAGVVEVSPLQAVWATSISERVKTNDRDADYEIVEVIPVGARVLAAGRIGPGEPGGPVRLLARGTEPAAIVATSSVGEPRAWLQRLAVARAIRAVALIGLGVAAGSLIF